jgi:uncharacterized RDD family membrane protein YckC
MVIASPWRRLVASFVDGLILVPVTLLLMALAGVDWVNTTPLQNFLFQLGSQLGLLRGLHCPLRGHAGQDAPGHPRGKNRRPPGGPAHRPHAGGGGQNPVRLAPGPRLPVGLLPSPKRQAWHDLIADTLVVHRESQA